MIRSKLDNKMGYRIATNRAHPGTNNHDNQSVKDVRQLRDAQGGTCHRVSQVPRTPNNEYGQHKEAAGLLTGIWVRYRRKTLATSWVV